MQITHATTLAEIADIPQLVKAGYERIGPRRR
jgi:hypothetical protein